MSEDKSIPVVCQVIVDIEWLLAHDEIALGHTATNWRTIVEALKALVERVDPGALAVHVLGADGPASDAFAQPSLPEADA